MNINKKTCFKYKYKYIIIKTSYIYMKEYEISNKRRNQYDEIYKQDKNFTKINYVIY